MANINKNIIMQAGAAVANAANKAAGLSAATPEPGSIISAIQLVNGGRTVGPAALAHFTESVRNKLLSLLVSMEPIQDFNGYGHPWPGGAGKNKAKVTASVYSGSAFAKDYEDNAVTVYNTTTSPGYKYSRVVVMSATPYAGQTLTFTAKATVVTGTNLPRLNCRLYESDQTTSAGSILFELTGTSFSRSFTLPDTIDEGVVLCLNLYSDSAEGGASEIRYYDIQIEAGSTATDFAPYENICPITGRTGLSVCVGPTSAIGDATTYSMDWTSPAGTVYAGSADVVSGDIKAAPYYASYNGETLVGPWVSSMDVYDPEGTPTTGAQVVDLGGTMTEYHITGQDIITLVGDNYIWSDSGDVTITE